MANFSVYDDIGFYWFFMSILICVLLPWTLSYLMTLVWSSPSDSIRTSKSFWSRVSWSTLVFVLLWALFLYLVVQVAHYSEQKMATFDPYEILGVEKGANLTEIKKAYRALSLVYHPDKQAGGGEKEREDAEQNFIRINKAHQVLTDETTRENYEKYGNPDGYQGTSVTIGLPSFLTNASNEKVILLGYFFIFFVLIPLIVYSISSRVSKYHDNGVLHNTIGLFVNFIDENWSTKFLIQTLSGAEEFQLAFADRAVDPETVQRLAKEIDRLDVTAKVKKDKPGNFYVITLIHAYLLRLDIPAVLQEDLKVILQNAPKLLETMFDITLSKKFFIPSRSSIELTQLLAQGLWLHQSPFLQLPFLTEETLKPFSRKGIKTLRQLASLSKTARRELYLSNDVWSTLNIPVSELKRVITDRSSLSQAEIEKELVIGQLEAAVLALPFVEISTDYEIPGENESEKKYIREGDMIKLTVRLERLHLGEAEVKKEGGVAEKSVPAKSCCDRVLEIIAPSANDPNSLDSLLEASNNSVAQNAAGESRLAYSYRCPVPKAEKWVVILNDVSRPGENTIGVIRVSFPVDQDFAEGRFMINAQGAKGKLSYEVKVFCDSYVSMDPDPKPVQIVVNQAFSQQEVFKQKKEQQKILLAASKMDSILEQKVEESLAEGEEEVDYDPQYDDVNEKIKSAEDDQIHWYYLYNSTLTEAILTVILLFLLGVVVFDILHSRGDWQVYVQPVLDRIWLRVEPFIPKGDNVLNQLLKSLYSFFAAFAAQPDKAPVVHQGN